MGVLREFNNDGAEIGIREGGSSFEVKLAIIEDRVNY